MAKSILVVAAVGLAVLYSPCGGDGDMEQTKQTERPLVVTLPPPTRDGGMSLERALHLRRSVREYSSAALSLDQLSQLLFAAQGVTADWGGRTAPSAGALYPLELYAVAGRVAELPPGVYRYEPGAHRLIGVRSKDHRALLAAAALEQAWVADAAAVLVVAAVYGRTTVKYGKRGDRYVHMEVGHAAQNVYLQAASLGLGTVMVGAFDDRATQRVLGLPLEEKVLALLPVGPVD